MRSLLLLLGTATLIACSPITAPESGEAIDGGQQANIDATVNCTESSDCGSTTPICNDQSSTCQACSTDSECTGLGGGDRCSATGACVACTTDEHCVAPSAAICDANETCRGCVANDECFSGACDLQVGLCENVSNIVYVGGSDASDAGTCTQAAPCASISFGLNRMTALRNTIVVAPGIYSERILTPSLPEIRIIGTGVTLDGGSVAVNQGDGLFETPFASHVRVEGMEVKDSSAAGIHCRGDASVPGASSITLDGVKVIGSSGSGLSHKDPCDAYLTGVTVSANGVGTGPGGGGPAITWQDADLHIDRSLISGNPNTAIDATDTALSIQNTMITGNGSDNYNRIIRIVGTNTAQAVVLRYNTIASNLPGCVPTVQYQGTSQPVIFDSNIVYDNLVTCSGNVDHNGNLPSNNIIEIPEGQTALPDGNFSEDPLFTNVDLGDYTLQQTSVGIDKGTVTNAPNEDHRGNPRPSGAAPDIGAMESF